MELNTERLRLREIEHSDLEALHALNSIPEVDEFNTLGLPENMDVTRQLLSGFVEYRFYSPRAAYVWAAELKSTGEFIGTVGLKMGRINYRNAEIWYKLHPTFWGLGYATEAGKAVLDLCFETLNLHRVEAGCAVGNMASARVLEKMGMKKEGYKREVLPIRGAWVDGLSFAILEKDYLRLK